MRQGGRDEFTDAPAALWDTRLRSGWLPRICGLNYPVGVAVDGAGNLYVTDQHNNRVLKLPAH